MEFITSRTVIRQLTAGLMADYVQYGHKKFMSSVHEQILQKKIKFPLLEYAASEFFQLIPSKEQIRFTNTIIDFQTICGNVIAGIILQKRLPKHFNESISKAVDYIIQGNEWYVCDIIGERVMGYALLKDPEKTLTALRKLSKHENKWIVRSVGVATHYAIKKGLKKEFVEEMFQLLLSLSHATEFHTKKGVGWAAKTTAKFYPSIIKQNERSIATAGTWFRTKIKIGLGRSFKYASRFPA